MVTKVNPEYLVKIAPHLLDVRTGQSPFYERVSDRCYSYTRRYFNGHLLSEELVEDPTNPVALQMRELYRPTVRPFSSPVFSVQSGSNSEGFGSLGKAFEKL
jgi:hypothetical protein